MTTRDLESLLPRNKRIFLILSNIIVPFTIFLDLLYITKILVLPLGRFALYNLIILAIALYSFRIKRQVNKELAKIRSSKVDKSDT